MNKFIKILACIACFALFTCAGCKENDPDYPSLADGSMSRLALITGTTELEVDFDYASIWEGVVNCSESNNLNYSYYRPAEMTDEAIVQQFQYAIEDGATVVICMGDVFVHAIKTMQESHPDVKFVILDVSEESIGALKPNTHTVMFRQEQGGYLAGFGAVKDGFTKLGFMGDHPAEAYDNYLNGFVAGANDAAKVLNASIEINIAYKTDYESEEIALNAVDAWYKEGTELIMVSSSDEFTAGCAEKAVENMGYIIGTDNDQSHLGANLDYNPFLTSSMKGVREAVDATLEMMLAGSWDEEMGGKTLYFGLQNGNYIYLPEYEATWLFKGFSLDEYNALKSKISQGEIMIDGQNLPKVDENLVKLKIISE